MDFKGEYFEEEEEIRRNLTPAEGIKMIFKFLLYFIAIAVYGVIMFRIFVSCDSDLVNHAYMSDNARALYSADPAAFELYTVHTTNNTNEDGYLQLKNIVYSPDSGELEVGVKFRDKITGGRTDAVLDYTLTDSNDNTYKLVSRKSDMKFYYGYERLSFEGVSLDLDSNIMFRAASSADSTTSLPYNETSGEKAYSGTIYTFSVFYNGELQYEFDIYDNETPLILSDEGLK